MLSGQMLCRMSCGFSVVRFISFLFQHSQEAPLFAHLPRGDMYKFAQRLRPQRAKLQMQEAERDLDAHTAAAAAHDSGAQEAAEKLSSRSSGLHLGGF